MSEAAPAVGARTRSLTRKQVMSLLGIVPLGVYVVMHLWTNMYSLAGAEAFDARIGERQSPVFIFLEVFGLGVPFLVHIGIGLRAVWTWITGIATGKAAMKQRSLANLRYVLQRLSAIGVLGFLVAHVIKARILPAMTPTGHETWAGMHEALSEPATFTVYALGLLGVSYHLANGLWGSAMTFGLTVTPRGQARMEWVSVFALLLLLAMSFLAIYGFHPAVFGGAAQ